LLDAYLEQTQTPGAMARLAWADVDRVLELAWRNHASLEEPAAAYTTWHNAYSYADVTEQRPDPDSSRWRLFGGVPTGTASAAPAANFGFALRSGMLSLSSGRRKLTFTLGFSSQGFSGNRIRAALGLPDNIGGESLSKGLARVLQIEVSTEKGWVELPLVSATLTDGQGSDYFSLTGRTRPDDQVYPAIQLQVLAESTAAALAAPAGESLPQLRVMLRPTWDAAAAEWVTALGAFEGLSWSRGHLAVEVNGLSDVRLQAEDRAIDPKKASEPFGRSPVKGSRLYLSHPELVQNRLDSLGLRWEWVGLPTTLVDHYKNYPGSHTSDQFTAQLSLVDNHLLFPVQSLRLFGNDAADPRGVVRTPTTQSIDLPTLPTLLAANGGGSYGRRSGATVSADLREDVRCWMLELGSTDFGHSTYGDLATERARALSLALATTTDKSSISSAAYQVNSPYTPSLRALTVNYSSSLELSARGGTEGDVLLHIHPFGSSPPSAQDPGLFPATPYAGELYIGLKDVQLPQQLSLLVQLAEGTSDPDAPPATLSWWILDGHVWQELLVLQDSSRGLLNSGILTLKLPEVGTAQRLSP
ncbi:MAG TPA: hypothetical protein PKW90_15170, partial [Myxococcota bacterium]|nr:hypothetical protein [Myxococcota bacterium]